MVGNIHFPLRQVAEHACLSIPPAGSEAMFYLAAAVSDFYIPASEMPEHKIQSSEGPLQVRPSCLSETS